jgi:uncharacterized protein (DUF427 family)
MPQFPMTDSRRKVLERIPDYAVAISPYKGTVTVKSGDTVIAETKSALLIQESRHDDVYYLPRDDVDLTSLASTDQSTYCPFKGHASYWSYKGNSDLENFVWSYDEPYVQVEALTGYMSFYTSKVDQIVG